MAFQHHQLASFSSLMVCLECSIPDRSLAKYFHPLLRLRPILAALKISNFWYGEQIRVSLGLGGENDEGEIL